MRLDLEDHPEWAEYTPEWAWLDMDEKKPEGGCPFAHLWK